MASSAKFTDEVIKNTFHEKIQQKRTKMVNVRDVVRIYSIEHRIYHRREK